MSSILSAAAAQEVFGGESSFSSNLFATPEGDDVASAPTTTSSASLDTLRMYDQLRSQATSVTRAKGSNIDIFSAGSREIPLCHFSTIFPFTEGTYLPRQNNFEDGIAAALAAQHLNAGDGSVVPAIEGLNERCPVRFTMEFSDTKFQGGVTLGHVHEQTSRELPDRLPSAFIGAYRSAVSTPMSIATGLLGYPQVSSASTSPDLDDVTQYPLFGRTVPSDAGGAHPLVKFLHEKLQVQHLAIINVNDAYGNAYVESMRSALELNAPDMVIHQIPVDLDESSIKAAVASLKDSGYRFVFCVVFGVDFHDALLEEAYNQEVAGTGLHTWIMGDSFGGVLKGRTFPKDSPLEKAYQGVGLYEVSGGLPGLPKYDHFSEAMARLKNVEDMEYLRKLVPHHDDHPEYIDGLDVLFSKDDFLFPLTSTFAALSYEAVVALGLAACDAYAANPSFSGQEHFDSFKNSTFESITGTIIFDPVTGTRDPTSAMFKVTNWLAEDVLNWDTGELMVKFVGTVSGLFQDAEWNEVVPYVFNDGTTHVPEDLPPPTKENEFNLGLLIGIAVALAIVMGVIVFLFYENKRKQNDSIWKIKKEDIKFADVPEVIGQGSFGEVLLGEYRGTQVVVKRVKLNKKGGGSSKGMESAIGTSLESAPSNGSNSSNLGMRSVVTGNILGLNNFTNVGFISGYRFGVAGATTSTKAKRRSEFLEEMRALSQLRHPCITTIMGAFSFTLQPFLLDTFLVQQLTRVFNFSGAVTGRDPMIVMEYMEHGSLYDILHNETMPIEGELLLPILRDIAQGVRFLHSAVPQVIHGDLKSANILIDNKFRAKVADFGLSSKKNKGGTGTPFWMAPELLRNESGNTAATDVYSFGIILFEVYSRRDPYDGEDPEEVLKLVADEKVKKRPPAPRNMCDKVKSLMQDCVEEDPDKRPSFEELDLRVKRIDAESAVEGQSNSNKSSSVSLFDIFPRHIAEALRDGRSVEPEHRNCVTIFFSDIVGFTNISSELEPQKIAAMLDRLYSKFDDLSHKHDIFKLETIGMSLRMSACFSRDFSLVLPTVSHAFLYLIFLFAQCQVMRMWQWLIW